MQDFLCENRDRLVTFLKDSHVNQASGLAEHPWALREIFMFRNIESSGLRVGWEAEGPDAHPGEPLARMLL